MKLKFTVSGKDYIDDEFGKIAIDYEGTTQDGVVVLSKRNVYRIKKEPPR